MYRFLWLTLWSFFMLCLIVLYPLSSYALRDPTKPATKINEDDRNHSGLVLTSILVGKNRKIAIVNNKIVRVGSIIEGAKVVAIEPNFVHFRGEDGDFSIFLHRNDIKKSVKN